MDVTDLSGFSGVVPVFPLPNVILFPKTVLPLHIYEPRYREMTARALKGERLIAMALLKPGWEPGYQGNPPVHEIIGVGRIIHEQKLSDGRYNMLLYGLSRGRIVSMVSESPYRTARVEILEDRGPAKESVLEKKRLHLLAVYMSLAEKLVKDADHRLDPDTPIATLCDAVTAMIDVPIAYKQSVMEELDVAARLDRVLEILKHAVLTRPAPENRWPPSPSMN